MTQEEKQILLQDICARLPYLKTWVRYEDKDYVVTGYGHGRVSLLPSIVSSAVGPCPLVEEVRPYLRPMSSMTEEESKELYAIRKSTQMTYSLEPKELDWLNAHHFDYRIDPSTGKTLIESNLAIEAPKDMYKNE